MCLYCVLSVSEELSVVDGVEFVIVNLNVGGIFWVIIYSVSFVDFVVV